MTSSAKLLLGAIVLLSFFLRFYKVTQNPPSLSWDEVSIGYNAYSILKTGRDEHGRFLPLDTFVAYGDYKPPLPIYATVPFVAVFGLNELAVRLPSVLAGALTVLMAYFLVQELFREKKNSSFDIWNLSFGIPITVSLLLAISPWHILLSRAGFEANIALFFVVLGVYLVLRARNHPKLLIFCWLSFVAGIYAFNSTRYFVPLLVVALVVFCRHEFFKHKRQLMMGALIALMALLPIAPHLVSKESRLRFNEVSIFNELELILGSNARSEADGNPWWGRILHNRRIAYARSYLIHFLDHLEPRFLFIRGDGNPKFSIQEVGQLYWVEAPLLLAGIFLLFRSNRQVAALLLFWMLSAIAPAAVARETPHALRIENSLPVWHIFIAYAALIVLKRKILLVVLALLYFGNFSYFWHQYLVHYPKDYSGEWQYGYREAIRFVSGIKDGYDTIVVSESIGRPHMYVLFYERIDPKIYWETKKSTFDAAGFYLVFGFDKYRFTRVGVEAGKYPGRVLYVLPPPEVPGNARVLQTIKMLNGSPALVVFDSV